MGERRTKMKRKLIAAAFSLAMAFVLMTSASFAWFTVSTAPEVTSMEMQIEATKNLEIAKAGSVLETAPGEVTNNDANDETKWGARISSFTPTSGTNFPAVASGSSVKTIAYDESGRTTGGYQALTLNEGIYDGASATIPYTAPINPDTAPINPGTGTNITRTVGMGYCMWLRSNQDLSNVQATLDTSSVSFSGFKNDGQMQQSDVTAILYVNGNATAFGTDFNLTRNTATPVRVVVFLNGDHVVAEDYDGIGTAPKISGIKVTFGSTSISN